MKHVGRQIIRGVGTLPHVGSHPGTYILLLMIGGCALAGARSGGTIGALLGALFMVAGMGPIYLYGAYDRARLSDALEALNHSKQGFQPSK